MLSTRANPDKISIAQREETFDGCIRCVQTKAAAHNSEDDVEESPVLKHMIFVSLYYIDCETEDPPLPTLRVGYQLVVITTAV